jgi:hypothetical protein
MTHSCADSKNGTPFVAPSGLMMSDVLLMLEDVRLPEIRRRDFKSAIRSVCRLIDRLPEEVPANINWVHVRRDAGMADLHPFSDPARRCLPIFSGPIGIGLHGRPL